MTLYKAAQAMAALGAAIAASLAAVLLLASGRALYAAGCFAATAVLVHVALGLLAFGNPLAGLSKTFHGGRGECRAFGYHQSIATFKLDRFGIPSGVSYVAA